MKKILLLSLGLSAMTMSMFAGETVELNGKEYEINTLIDRDLGPGVHYTRLRIPGYPLNVNMLRIDVTNPYNSVEVQQGGEKLYSTESLVSGAKRNSGPGHVALAGANANFWCVSPQPPYSEQIIGATYNGNLKNGKIITETNCKNDKYNGGLKHTGITGISVDNKVYSSNNFSWEGWVSSAATGDLEIFQCNKIVRDGELALYNSFYPSARTFRCVDQYNTSFTVVQNTATEVYLTMNTGQEWSAGDNMTFTVKDIKTKAGNGTLGEYDLALVGRGGYADALAKLTVGDEVTVRYNWIAPDGTKVKMNNLVGGNAQVMVDGELTSYNDSETYNSQVYSRTGYGCNADGTMMYIIVIDKSTDPVYGVSGGCPTRVMCELAKHYGCVNMTNFDAGGSAMMMVGDKIINKTTESNPRAVANGMIAFSTAPEDNTVARLEFYDYELKAPIYASSTPRIIAFNQYGAVLDDNFTNVTFSCPEAAGTCEGNVFKAGANGTVSELTATYNGVSVTKPITIVESELALRIKPVVIDFHREYPIEVTAKVDENVFTYNPADISWDIKDPTIVSIDANGVLKGLKEGTTEYTAIVGSFSDTTPVAVEAAKATKLPLDGDAINASDWNISYASTKNGVITPKGSESGFNLDFNISSTRGARITLAKDINFYSLPDAVEFVLNPGQTSIKNIVFSIQPANENRPVSYTYEATFETGVDHKISLPLSLFGDTDDLITYPFTFSSIAIYPNGPSGDNHIEMKSMHVLYDNFADGVEGILMDGLTDDGKEHLYNLDGTEVSKANVVPGLYIKVAEGKATKVIVK